MTEKLHIDIPEFANVVINSLNESGFKAYVVGGFVRDSLLNKKPKDCDIASNAIPDEVIRLFESKGFQVIPTGIDHGTVTVMVGKESVEVTTFRKESGYSDSRHPDKVEFVTNIYSDLSRRDFTMNAMAYNHETGLIDPFDGHRDLTNGIIKCVGNPNERFEEDPLRMLRAIRFLAKLPHNFDIDDATFVSIHKNAELIKRISAERIRDEFNQILMCDAQSLVMLRYTRLLSHIVPEFDNCFDVDQKHPAHYLDVARHTMNAIDNISSELHLKLTMFFHDIGKPLTKETIDGVDHFYGHAQKSVEIAENVMKRLKYDNEAIDKVLTLVKYHDVEMQENKPYIKRMLNKIGVELFRDLLKVRQADTVAQNPDFFSERYTKIVAIKGLLESVLAEQQAFTVKHLEINGNDLIEIGFKQGKIIGEILEILLEIVIENPDMNNKEILKLFVMEKLYNSLLKTQI